MSENLDRAKLFFDACETGKGWDVCRAYCHPDATFSAQSGVLSDIDTLEGYSEWMKNLLTRGAWISREGGRHRHCSEVTDGVPVALRSALHPPPLC